MATYVVSDLHGCYDKYLKIFETIDFKVADTLYVLGDVVDRGPEPMKILKDMMMRPNVRPLVGNHEVFTIICIRILSRVIDDDMLENLKEEDIQAIADWQAEGGNTTMAAFAKLTPDEREDIMEYLGEFELYEELSINGKDYVLVHAGLKNFSQDRPLDDYELNEMIEGRLDYSMQYFSDKYLVTGHTPTRMIRSNPKPDYIYRANNHIAIDCGAVFGGRLAVLCLDTDEEYYIE